MADVSLIFNIVAKDKTGPAFDKVKAGAAVAGAAIGAALIGAVNTAMDKSRLDNKVASQLGATPAQAAEIGKLSGSVYSAGFGEDMPGVAMAIKDAAQNGLVDMDKISGEAAQKTTQNLLTVSSVLEEDTSRVSAAVSQMLRTGMAQSAEQAMDILVKSTQNGVNKSQDLLDTFNEYSTQFRKLGLDGTHAMGLISQAIKAGARDSDTAADALKEFSIRSIDGSAKTVAAYKALNLNADQMAQNFAKGGDVAAESFNSVMERLRAIKDPVERNTQAVALFGTKAEDLGESLFAMNLDTAKQEMDGVKGATSQAAATAAQGAASWSTLGRQFQMALVDTLNMALPAVNAVFGFMQRNSSWVQPLAIGLAALAVAIGVVTAVQWAWNAALAISPVTWIVLGIVVLIAVIVAVATKTTWFQTIWKAVWGFMKGVGAWFAGPFTNFFKTAFNLIVGYYKFLWNSIKTVIGWVVSYYKFMWNTWSSVVSKVINAGGRIVSFFKSAPGKIRGALSSMFNGLWTGFRSVVNKIVSGWNNLSFSIPGFSFAGMNVGGFSVGTPNLPYLDTGGTIKQTGLAVVHQGERVVKKAEVTRTGQFRNGGGGGSIVISGTNNKVVRVLLELLREGIRDQGGDPVKVLTAR